MSTYISGQYDKDEGFIELRKHLEEREGNRENRNRYVKCGDDGVLTFVKDFLYGSASECVHACCAGIKEECLSRERNCSIDCIPPNRR